MSFSERLLYHQIHPVKIACDLTAGTLGLILLWRGSSLRGALVVLVPSISSSAILISFSDLRPYRRSAAGRYLHRYITMPNQILRLLSFGAMAVGCRRHDRVLVGGGFVGVVACWFYGLIPMALRPGKSR